jgi:FkbM family methyltransferase
MFYIDIGTNDPIMINNTYKLYRHGATGILVEPNPEFENRIRKKREKDIYLQMGIMPEGDGSLTYYEMSRDTLNTFSQQDAIDACKKGYRILKETKIPIISVKKFCDKYVKGKEVGVLSVDVEGYDFDIIRKWPYDEIRPVIICLETIEFTTGVKRKDYFDIIEFMRERGYMIYADTCINTLFVDSQRHLES